jgi:hypothetical protein
MTFSAEYIRTEANRIAVMAATHTPMAEIVSHVNGHIHAVALSHEIEDRAFEGTVYETVFNALCEA